jgi:hypothetical protein
VSPEVKPPIRAPNVNGADLSNCSVGMLLRYLMEGQRPPCFSCRRLPVGPRLSNKRPTFSGYNARRE